MARKSMLRAVREKEVKNGQEPFKLRFDACIVAYNIKKKKSKWVTINMPNLFPFGFFQLPVFLFSYEHYCN